MQQTETVNIPAKRYIELLEAEVSLLKAKYATPPNEQQSELTIPITSGSCVMHDITRKIHASGITVKTWAMNHGFDPATVRMVICGQRKRDDIHAALKADGFVA